MFILCIYVLSVSGAFDDPEITHVDDTVDPVRDLETISQELRLKVMFLCVNKFYDSTSVLVELASFFFWLSNKAYPEA